MGGHLGHWQARRHIRPCRTRRPQRLHVPPPHADVLTVWHCATDPARVLQGCAHARRRARRPAAAAGTPRRPSARRRRPRARAPAQGAPAAPALAEGACRASPAVRWRAREVRRSALPAGRPARRPRAASDVHAVHLAVAQRAAAGDLFEEAAVADGDDVLLRARLHPAPEAAHALLRRARRHASARLGRWDSGRGRRPMRASA